MKFVVDVCWELRDSDPAVEDLVRWVEEEARDRYQGFPGVAEKHWYWNPILKRWGAVYLVHDPHALDPDRLPDFGGGRTGPMARRPDWVEWNMWVSSVQGKEFAEHWG